MEAVKSAPSQAARKVIRPEDSADDTVVVHVVKWLDVQRWTLVRASVELMEAASAVKSLDALRLTLGEGFARPMEVVSVVPSQDVPRLTREEGSAEHTAVQDDVDDEIASSQLEVPQDSVRNMVALAYARL
ncbi:hypothetical protein P3T76_001061 [Phytophthora citrophthora]|uniref:Uncharacterized protein n=1 Tax=Phytophthora citrophthora TaxID=4793 RepID=A0AAD9GYR9_9STRA|nr:hypothetical protein P3T76_001061 [Phytophthora citrophthora]